MQTSSNFIAGERVYLRDILISDVKQSYLDWMNDEEVIRYLESRFKKYTLDELKSYVEQISQDPSAVFLAIVLKDGDRHIGNLKIGNIDRNHRSADIGLIIGEKTCWGKGYAAEAIGLATDYAFGELGLHKLIAGCYENNLGSAKAFQKVGYEIEGRLKSQYFFDGRHLDAICLGKINPKEI